MQGKIVRMSDEEKETWSFNVKRILNASNVLSYFHEKNVKVKLNAWSLSQTIVK